MSLLYLALIPLVGIGYMFFADSQFKAKDKKYVIPTISFSTVAPTGTRAYGYSIAGAKSTISGSGVETIGAAASVAPDSEVVYLVVTATPSPVPSLTPNPYGTLHLTLTRLVYILTTATPFAATQIYRPLYYQGSDLCFANCGFVTATLAPLPTQKPN